MSSIFSGGDTIQEESFCWILEKPDYLPWFISHVERWARTFRMTPSPCDIAIRVKWILLDQKIAATPHLTEQCQTNRGNFNGYRFGTTEEHQIAFLEAISQLGFPEEFTNVA